MHVYWAAGGKTGWLESVPSVDGKRAFEPSAGVTLGVAIALLTAMLVVIGNIGWLGETVPPFVYNWITLAIGLMFLLRAIGDFGLVGFFKTSKDSRFAYLDTRLYSPLCVVVTILSFALIATAG